LQRLSGPFLDRFSIFTFTEKWLDSPTEVAGSFILAELEALYSRHPVPTARMDRGSLEKDLDPFWFKHVIPEGISYRRREAILRIAWTAARLNGSDTVGKAELAEALEWAYLPFHALNCTT
jgi:predicted ATPase with chaperone activity